VKWFVAKSYTDTAASTGEPDPTGNATPASGRTYTSFEPYNPLDPYNPNGPVAVVDQNGKVTALRDGVCYIYAEAGGAQSDPCKITVTKVAPTGVTLNKKKYSVSVGTFLTLTANVKPAGASNKRVKWTSSDTSIAKITNENIGIIETISTGVVTIKATTLTGGFSAECVLTVMDAPSIIKNGKTVTLSVLGAGAKDTMRWTLAPVEPSTGREQKSLSNGVENELVNADGDVVLSGTRSGAKYKLRSSGVGNAIVTGEVLVTVPDPADTEDGEQQVVVRQQSWYLESVVPISKMEFRDEEGNIVKKLTVGVDKNGKNGDPVILTLKLVKPLEATLLGFTWVPKVDRATGKEMLKIEPVDEADIAADENGVKPIKIKVTGLIAGTAKITGINANGNKKINLSVKVMQYPSKGQIQVKSTAVQVVPGKKVTIKGKVSDRGVNKDLRYTLYDGSTIISGWDPINKVYVDDSASVYGYLEIRKGKQTGKVITRTLPEGEKSKTLKLEIRGAPYADKGTLVSAKNGMTTVTIDLVPPPPKT
ncbi:MAG: Ig-like domain-containing protein, partial [Oscillospiraceae bacterium]|nr:Ig-like domain-containing protein [Oscillospiraceae bacterium]